MAEIFSPSQAYTDNRDYFNTTREDMDSRNHDEMYLLVLRDRNKDFAYRNDAYGLPQTNRILSHNMQPRNLSYDE